MEKEYTSQFIQMQIAKKKQNKNYSMQADLMKGKSWQVHVSEELEAKKRILNEEKEALKQELQKEYSAQERLQKEAKKIAKKTGMPDDLVK